MNTRIEQYIFFILALACPIFSYTQINWMQTYEAEEGSYRPQMHIETNDGNYVMLAGQLVTWEMKRSVLQKITPEGEVLWTKTIDTTYHEARGLAELADGSLIVVIPGLLELRMIKMDASGEIIWVKNHEFYSSWSVVYNTLTLTQDGGFLVATSKLNTNPNIAILRTNSEGEEIWQKTFYLTSDSTSSISYGAAVKELEDGTIMLLGTGQSTFNGNMLAFHLDENGNELWRKIYDYSTDYEVATQIEYTCGKDGFYLLGFVAIQNKLEAILIRTDLEGNEIWVKNYGSGTNAELAPTMTKTQDNGLLITYSNNASGSFKSFVVKVDEHGEELCSIEYGEGGGTDTRPKSISEKEDGRFLITGSVKSCSTCSTLMYALETAVVCSDMGEACLTSTSQIPELEFSNIFPNPTTEELTLEYELLTPTYLSIQLVDVRGQKLQTISAYHKAAAGLYQKNLNLDFLDTGVYFLQIQSEEQLKMFKIVKI